MVTTAPRSSLVLNFSFIISTEKGIISTGTMDINADATPVVVNLIAHSENDTPRKGPKNAPIDIRPNAFWFFRACPNFFHLPKKVKIMANPIMPVSTLI